MSFIVVHLTDLHMKESANNNPILAKVKRVCSALNGTVKKDDTVLLAFTGDLAFSGKKSEYNNCELFISSITEYICAQKNAKVHVAFVPGNHDCNFAENQDVRNALITSVKNKTSSLTSAIILSVSNVQKDFFEFAERNGNPWKNRISEALCIETDIGKVSIHLINSAWDSILHEIPGQLLMPEVHIPEEITKDTALSLTLIHHPLHWLSPDSVHSLSETFRRYTDVLFVGHEHRADKLTMKGEKWTYSQFNGKELQNSECANDSSFSVYTWDNLQKVKILEYAWDTEKQFYDRVCESEQDVALNQMRTRGCVYPNSKTLEMLRDIGATIHHFRIDAVSLEDLYCWPEIDVLPTDESKVKNPVRISNDIPQNISNYRVPLIVGSPNCGKTSLLKSLYSYYLSQGICCLSCNGIDLVSSTESGITRIIEEQFCKQYNQSQLEEFRQMTTSSKVLLIDDFESMTFNLERQSRIINHLLESFQRVILFSGSDVDISMLLAIRFAGSDEKIVPLRIRPFGNKKRNELITKWYSLGDEYAFEDSEMKLKADQARDVIDGVLGSHRTIVPATPIVVISLLQNLEAFSTSTFAGSQYGYLYENLVNRSLAAIHNTNPGTMNIHVAVLSRIAYNMLIDKKKSFSEIELINLVHVFVADRLVPVDAIALLSNMMSVRLIKKDEGGSYRFSYPYIFYYFCGKYIATHIEEDAVKELVVYMSERLFIEDYGNIIIFVCHFCNSLHIIESVLLNSYSLFDKVHPFSFEEPQRILDLANNAIERFLVPKVVGQESEVKARREEMLKRMDEAGVRDGSVSPDENDNIENETDQEKNIAEFVSAMKTMDVLGQIIRNYPGDISGQDKLDMIEEVHSIGLRIITMFFDILGFLEEDLIKTFAEEIKARNSNLTTNEVVRYVKGMLDFLLTRFTRSMISRIAHSLASEHLITANERALNPTASISGQLVLFAINYSFLRTPIVNDSIKLYQEYEKRGFRFASAILKSIVADYLVLNECGHEVRDRLCSAFGLEKTRILVEKGQATT